MTYYWLLLSLLYGAVITRIIANIWKMSRCWWHHFQDKKLYSAFFFAVLIRTFALSLRTNILNKNAGKIMESHIFSQ